MSFRYLNKKNLGRFKQYFGATVLGAMKAFIAPSTVALFLLERSAA